MGRGGWDRTIAYRDQNPMPYHLATPLHLFKLLKIKTPKPMVLTDLGGATKTKNPRNFRSEGFCDWQKIRRYSSPRRAISSGVCSSLGT